MRRRRSTFNVKKNSNKHLASNHITNLTLTATNVSLGCRVQVIMNCM
jgi:hypothetical protein